MNKGRTGQVKSKMAERSRIQRSKIQKNKRERERIKALNKHFATLKVHLPNGNQITTKAEILQSAVEYIDFLEDMVQDFQEKELEKIETLTEPERPSCRYSKEPAASYLQPQDTTSLLTDQFAETHQEIHFENEEWRTLLGE